MSNFSTADAVRFLREKRKMSARALSLASGFSPSYISKVESGEVQPTLRAFACIARELQMTHREILYVIAAEGARREESC